MTRNAHNYTTKESMHNLNHITRRIRSLISLLLIGIDECLPEAWELEQDPCTFFKVSITTTDQSHSDDRQPPRQRSTRYI
jgi:hypothetical protein